jgi:inorganic pyrophosphatase
MKALISLPALVDDDTFLVVVESPRGSGVKFKFDVDLGVMSVSRPLPAGLTYPYDWGFVPSTRAPDGDPLDVVVMWDASSYPGVAIPCRALGVLQVEQRNRESGARERNDRVAALPVKAPRSDSIRSIADVPERARRELEQFFLAAVVFEGKDLKILGWAGPADAMALVRASGKKVKKVRR